MVNVTVAFPLVATCDDGETYTMLLGRLPGVIVTGFVMPPGWLTVNCTCVLRVR